MSHLINTALSRHKAVCTAAWFFISLFVIDLAINLVFAYPQDPKVTDPPRIRAQFEYGRSTEGQLLRMTRADRAATAPISLDGWYDPLEVTEYAAKKPHNPVVTIYGASHAVNLAIALGRISNNFTPRSVGAPGAPSNWAYGAYLRDRRHNKSHAVVLAFQSSSLPMLTSLTPMTWQFDSPKPYTADRFFLIGNELHVIHPPYTSFEQYVETLSDPKKWALAREYFAKNDPLYNPWFFRETIFDQSSLVRLVRRAYGQHVIRGLRHSVLDQTGFRPDSEQIKVAEAIIHEFARIARSDGSIPIVFLINDFGYSDFLYQALSQALFTDNIPYLSSHSIAPPNDPRAYLSDTHFTPKVDDHLAQALDEVVERGDERRAAMLK